MSYELFGLFVTEVSTVENTVGKTLCSLRWLYHVKSKKNSL